LTKGERLGPKDVSQIVKHGGGSIMIWGCMIAFGPSASYQIEPTLIQKKFRNLLAKYHTKLQLRSY